MVKDAMVKYYGRVKKRCVVYFEHLPNVDDVRGAGINVVGAFRMPVLGELNEKAQRKYWSGK